MAIVSSMESISRDQLNDALIRLNILRTSEVESTASLELLEGAMDALFSASKHLIVYGSLMPGGLNHGLLGGLEGEWERGWVTGELMERGRSTNESWFPSGPPKVGSGWGTFMPWSAIWSADLGRRTQVTS